MGLSVLTKVLTHAATGLLVAVSACPALARATVPLPWLAELPNSLAPSASIYVSEKSNIVLDFNAPREAAAQAWIDFMRSDSAASVYSRHGFDYASPGERNRVQSQ